MSQLQQIVRGGMNTYARNENGYFPLDLPDPLIAKQPAGIQLIAASPYLFYVCRTVRTICHRADNDLLSYDPPVVGCEVSRVMYDAVGSLDDRRGSCWDGRRKN